jgi:CcmD family protein
MFNVMRVVGPFVVAASLLLAGAPGAVAQESQAPRGPASQAAQDEYVPIDQLPESEKLPAAPFLTGAYAFAWLAILVYLLMLWRRLGRVEQELREARRAVGSR